MIRQMYEDPSNRPPIPHAESDEEDSEPESFVHMWNRTQAVDPVTQKDYWDQAIGSSYYNPVYGGMQSGGASFSETPFIGTQEQGTSSNMPHGNPNAPGGSDTVGSDLFGGLFGAIDPYVGMFPPPPPFNPPSQGQGNSDDDEE